MATNSTAHPNASQQGHSGHTRLLPYVVWLIILIAIEANAPYKNGGDYVTRNTVRVALLFYFAAAISMLHMRSTDWFATTKTGIARSCWTIGWISFVVHVLLAFKYFHHWDHNHAVEHTRQVSGVGWGIYFSYVFTLVWGLDVFSWWIWPTWYATRSAWIDWLLHGYMAFIIFNGTIVYEKGPIVWAGMVMFSILGLMTCSKLLAQSRISAISRDRRNP